MLIKLLPAQEREHLIELATLLALSDKPLLWDGKTSDELTSSTNLDELTIQEGEQECELIAELEHSAGITRLGSSHLSAYFSPPEVKASLLEALKVLPIKKAERPEFRAQASTAVLKELLKDKKFVQPSVPKVMLFELLLVALRDGNISSIEWALLKEFQQHHKLEDFIFDDLLERAEALNQEISKAISIVLE